MVTFGTIEIREPKKMRLIQQAICGNLTWNKSKANFSLQCSNSIEIKIQAWLKIGPVHAHHTKVVKLGL